MATAVWTPAAEADLDDILYYIAMVDRRRATGERIYFEIRDQAFDQAAKPHSGHTHPRRAVGMALLSIQAVAHLLLPFF